MSYILIFYIFPPSLIIVFFYILFSIRLHRSLNSFVFVLWRPCTWVYKQANFSQIWHYHLGSCINNSSSSPVFTSPPPDALVLASLRRSCFSWMSQMRRGCPVVCLASDHWLTSPLERYIENGRGSNTTGIAGPFTVPTQVRQSHLSWHHYGPRESLSSCPLKRHIESCRGTSTDIADPISCTQLVHHSYLCTHLVHLYSRSPNSCITHTRAPISCTSTLVHPTRAPISCTTNLVHPTRASLVLVHPSCAPLLSCTHLMHHQSRSALLAYLSYSRALLVHYSRAPNSCNTTLMHPSSSPLFVQHKGDLDHHRGRPTIFR